MNNPSENPRREPQKDKKNIRDIIEGNFSGFTEKLGRLKEMQVGRAVVIKAKDGDRHVGQILPVDIKQTKHLVIWHEGSVLLVEPKEVESNVAGYNDYQSSFKANQEDLEISDFGSRFDTMGFLNRFRRGGYFNKLTLDSTNPEDQQKLFTAIKESIITATELREQQEKAKKEVADYLISQLNAFFNPNSDSSAVE